VGAVARRLPTEALMELTRRWHVTSNTEVMVKSLLDSAWSELLSGTKMLWYARRRNVPHKRSISGQANLEAEDRDGERAHAELVKMLREAGLYDEFNALPTRASAIAISEVISLLSGLAKPTTHWQFAGLASTLLRLERIHHREYMAAQNRFPQNVRDGLVKLEQDPNLTSVPLSTLGAATRMAELGTHVMGLPPNRYSKFVTDLKALLAAGKSLDEAFLALRS